MKSVLNEENIFSTLEKMGQEYKNKNKSKDSHYLGGSISKYTKNLTMSFPVICDNTLSVDTMQLISKASEKNIVSMLQMLFASMSLSGNDGAEILKLLHMNMDADIEEIIDAMDKFCNENCEIPGVSDAQIRDAIREMVSDLKVPKKVFPADSFKSRSLNEYLVHNMNGKMVVLEDNSKPITTYDADQLANRRDQREAEKYEKEEERATQKRSEDKTKAGLDVDNMHTQLFQKQILDIDYKKANEIQPSLLVVNYNNVEDREVIERKSFIAGVKCRVTGADAMDIVERIVAKNRAALSFKNLIRATTGEISFFKDFLFAVNQQKMNAKNAAKTGYTAQLWNLLEKRAVANNYNKLRKKGNDASAITTLIINQETANYILSNYKIDLNNPSVANKVIDEYNLLALYLADEANEAVKFMYYGNREFETVAYSMLAREARDNKTYKDTVNLINKAGR